MAAKIEIMELQTVQVCESNDPYHVMLARSASHPGEFYTVMVSMPDDGPEDWICSCPGWRFRGHCKHLDTISPCHWEELIGPEEQNPEQKDSHTCPRCFGPTKDELQAI